ncbi:hypothetical protein Cch01nite_43110 [Cellulomonas chitinilytica]|uniref:Uncharacterized protein n=1 Tax=Cellulomonas chitinilytica TaxID=398759 RepID=A0A919U4M0_9CELL|nr:hypothetical protein Cch01nite_43110 [Cellulomonas chitinilytica]
MGLAAAHLVAARPIGPVRVRRVEASRTTARRTSRPWLDRSVVRAEVFTEAIEPQGGASCICFAVPAGRWERHLGSPVPCSPWPSAPRCSVVAAPATTNPP